MKYPVKRMAKEIANLRKEIEEKQDELARRVVLLRQVCKHTETKIKHHYIPGSYLDRSEDHEITFCSICGTELNDKVTKGFFG